MNWLTGNNILGYASPYPVCFLVYLTALLLVFLLVLPHAFLVFLLVVLLVLPPLPALLCIPQVSYEFNPPSTTPADISLTRAGAMSNSLSV